MKLKHILEKFIIKVWYPQDAYILFLSKILSPIGYIYIFGSYINKLKSKVIYTNKNNSNPHIIVVGNITAGGTGKTPIVIHIANMLFKKGFKVAVITRGYGGTYSDATPILINYNSDPIKYSDEAVLLANKLKDIPIICCRKRENSIKYIKDNYSIDIIISDDGLQYTNLNPDTKLLIVDGDRGFGNNSYIPIGPLRNSLSYIKNVDQVIINGNPNNELIQSISKYNKNILITKPIVKYVRKIYGSNEIKLTDLQIARNLILEYDNINFFTAIGNSKKFFDTALDLLNLQPDNKKIKYHSFCDHYNFIGSDFTDLKKTSAYVMTSKDAVKFNSIDLEEEICCFIIEIDVPLSMDFIINRVTDNIQSYDRE